MSDYLIQQVFNDSRLQVMVPGERMVVTVLSGDTVYYGDRRVSSTQNLGSLTVGQSITVTTVPTWLVSASISDVSLQGTPTAAGGSAISTVVALGSVTGAVSCNLSSGTVFTATVTGNTTFTFTGWPSGGVSTAPELYVFQDGAGGHSITIAGVTWLPSGTPPAFDTAAGHVNYVPFSSTDNGAHLYGYGASPVVNIVGAAGQPAFAAGWSNVATDGSLKQAQFYRDASGLVHIEGYVSYAQIFNTDPQHNIFTLPTGYVPLSGDCDFYPANPSYTDYGGSYVRVDRFGVVSFLNKSGVTLAPARVSLAGIVFNPA